MNAKVLIPIIFSTMLLCGSALAGKPKEPKIDDVNVINTPDVKLINDENSPVPVSIVAGEGGGAQTIVEYRVVGFTDTETNGGVDATAASGEAVFGYRAMHRLCEVEVAANSRAAFSDEYVRTPDLPSV